MPEPTLAVIVVAAGSGARLGADVPKAFAHLKGRTILEHAIEGVLASSEPAHIVVVAPASHLKQAQRVLPPEVTIVAGGDTRQDSVAAGLAALGPGIRTVLVHDAARALTSGDLFDRVVSAVVSDGVGVIPALPVTDTIKRVDPLERVIDTVDRSDLVHVQTPQGFPRAELDAAYAAATQEWTDDAAVFAAHGGTVRVIDGETRAFKITVPWDLRRAESILGAAAAVPLNSFRTGLGMDVHAFDESAPLWLGGLYWPDEAGLSGHSDGDAIAHSICDALLSAAGLGDIGSRFGTADPRFAGAHAEVFLTETISLVKGAGYAVSNVAVQLVANRPRIGERRTELESHLGSLVGAPVSVSATTSDGLGYTGEGKGVFATATALVHRAG
jgi:2-C-methyl-D-erythritol 4-phosphate cytidylyltransferase/2-C-methyl-D-erythritol 2,4-cyclodiphosphate synthase